MKNSLINREYLRTWHNIPALLVTSFIILLVAGPVLDALTRKEAQKWYAGLKERAKGQ